MLGFLQTIINGIQWIITLITNLFHTITLLFEFMSPIAANLFTASQTLQSAIPLPIQAAVSVVVTIMIVRLVCTLGFRS